MATQYILPKRGSIYKFSNSDGDILWKMDPQINVSNEKTAVLIRDVSIRKADAISKNVCFGDVRVVGVSGKNFGDIFITCLLLLGDGTSANTVLSAVDKYIEEQRVSKKYDVIKLSGGKNKYEFILTDSELSTLDPETNIMTLKLHGLSFD